MYKATVDTAAYLSRTGSHSLTPSRRGDNGHLGGGIDVSYIIESETDRVALGKKLLQVKDFLVFEKNEITKQLVKINEQLAVTLPMEKFKELNKKRKALSAQIVPIEAELRKIKDYRRGNCTGRDTDFRGVFIDIAREILPKEVFSEIFAASNRACQKIRDER